MKIYTRGGDGGETSLFGGGRVSKGHVRVEAYGAVDELNAALGMSVAAVADDEIRGRLGLVQQDLFDLGASLATPGAEDASARPSIPPIPAKRISDMEGWIDEATDETPPLRNFIIPGGSDGAAALHQARTVCRRAERRVVDLHEAEGSDPQVIRYLNRLSDLLFALARLENHRVGVADVPWVQDRP
jgi:cob(I)alamin adenosyltransferase